MSIITRRQNKKEEKIKKDFTINEMQKVLQGKYKDIWETISTEIGKNKLLWMIGEEGKVIDIIKKHRGKRHARMKS